MQLIKNANKNKLRGGFYTPNDIANFILKWAFNGKTDATILEPSCGNGVFLNELIKLNYQYKALTAIEYDKNEVKKAKKITLKKSNIINMDFHEYCLNTKNKFDLIIGNPPYIRYQYFNKKQQNLAGKIFNKAQLEYSKLTNAWVSFVIGASLLLENNGKLGFVLPAEILQVTYAKNIRNYLSKLFNKICIISFKKLVFPKIQQEVILFFGEKNNSKLHKIEHIEVRDINDLEKFNINRIKTPQKRIDFKANKWTFYFLDQKEIDFLEYLQNNSIIDRLSKYANVEVGITTGANAFFTVPLSIVKKYKLEKYVKPLVGRSVQVPSIIFNKNDWIKNRDNEARTHLLIFPTKDKIKNEICLMKYINNGEKHEIDKGYKCSIREEWQIIPSIKISNALFVRRNNLYPKLIINKANAYTTDTMHRVSIKKGVNKKAFIASYYNSLSLAYAEISGRSHGGGVLELMPNEVEEILLPFNIKNSELINLIDVMIRENKSIDAILEITNKEILKKNYGFSDKEIKIADNIRNKLQKRRLQRGKKK